MIALAKTENGIAPIMSVMEPAPYMEKGITLLLMKRGSPLMGTVTTSLLRYNTNLRLVFVIFPKSSCDTDSISCRITVGTIILAPLRF